MQLDLAKNLTKLVQTSRPQLQEESYLPFQSIYCTALDNDLELCASIQTSCGLLQGYKVSQAGELNISSLRNFFLGFLLIVLGKTSRGGQNGQSDQPNHTSCFKELI